jgi:hypothetical protein
MGGNHAEQQHHAVDHRNGGCGWNVSVAVSAVAQPPVEPTQAEEALLTNRYGSPSSETHFRLSDRQQLKSYFDGRFR